MVLDRAGARVMSDDICGSWVDGLTYIMVEGTQHIRQVGAAGLTCSNALPHHLHLVAPCLAGAERGCLEPRRHGHGLQPTHGKSHPHH